MSQHWQCPSCKTVITDPVWVRRNPPKCRDCKVTMAEYTPKSKEATR